MRRGFEIESSNIDVHLCLFVPALIEEVRSIGGSHPI